MNEKIVAILKKNPDFSGLQTVQIESLISRGEIKQKKPGEYILREGEIAKEILFLLSGNAKVVKQDPVTRENLTFGIVNPGDIIGEIALLDKGPRSADVIAATEVELLSIPFSQLSEETDSGFLYKVFFMMAQNISAKLRKTSSTAFDAFQKQIEYYRTQLLLCDFFVLLIFILCLFFFVTTGLRDAGSIPAKSFYFTLPLTLSCMFGMAYFAKQSHLPWSIFGVTLEKWKEALWLGSLFSIPPIALITLGKLLVIEYLAIEQHEMKPLFAPQFHPLEIGIYTLIIVPLQELFARGAIQGMLIRFLTGKYKVLASIVVSSLIFGTGHLFISFNVSLGTVLFSLYLGWIYSKYSKLLYVIIPHAIIGIWGFNILGTL